MSDWLDLQLPLVGIVSNFDCLLEFNYAIAAGATYEGFAVFTPFIVLRWRKEWCQLHVSSCLPRVAGYVGGLGRRQLTALFPCSSMRWMDTASSSCDASMLDSLCCSLSCCCLRAGLERLPVVLAFVGAIGAVCTCRCS